MWQWENRGVGSAQAGELTAVWSLTMRNLADKRPVCVYTDSYPIFMGHSEQVPFWEQNQWEISRVWQNVKWGEILKITRSIAVSVEWGTAQQKGDHQTQLLNNQKYPSHQLAILSRGKRSKTRGREMRLSVGMAASETWPFWDERLVKRRGK